MAKFSKSQTVMAFYNKGKNCVESAKFLFENNKFQSYDILLLHGLELLFKAFILMKDQNIEIDDLYNKYGHDYYKAYQDCLKLDKDKKISDETLSSLIKYLHDNYESNILEVRYPNKTTIRRFPTEIFDSLVKNFILPIKSEIGVYYSIAKADEGPFKPPEVELGYKQEYDL